MKLSIVSPVYKAEEIVEALVFRISNAVLQITDSFEIILVEDCGPDNSWEVIESVAKTNSHVKGLKLSKNFGQHYAITAGLDESCGEWVIVLDCDLQDVPEEIPKLYSEAIKGFDAVLAKRINRNDSFFKKFYSKSFFEVLSYLTGTKYDESIANFGIYNRKMIDTICKMREPIRSFPTLVNWVGFKTTAIEVKHDERESGESSYSFKRSLYIALDIILANSDKPLRLLLKLGLSVSGIGVLIAIIYLVKYLLGETTVLGFTSLIISVWFLSGIIISTLGILGIYIGKVFDSSKSRPLYIINNRTK
jgi:glycosyltransferase involved in cell wall biosynthesis